MESPGFELDKRIERFELLYSSVENLKRLAEIIDEAELLCNKLNTDLINVEFKDANSEVPDDIVEHSKKIIDIRKFILNTKNSIEGINARQAENYASECQDYMDLL